MFEGVKARLEISLEKKYSFKLLEIFRIFAKSNNCFADKNKLLFNFLR